MGKIVKGRRRSMKWWMVMEAGEKAPRSELESLRWTALVDGKRLSSEEMMKEQEFQQFNSYEVDGKEEKTVGTRGHHVARSPALLWVSSHFPSHCSPLSLSFSCPSPLSRFLVGMLFPWLLKFLSYFGDFSFQGSSQMLPGLWNSSCSFSYFDFSSGNLAFQLSSIALFFCMLDVFWPNCSLLLKEEY